MRHQTRKHIATVELDVVVHDSPPRGRLGIREPGYRTTADQMCREYLWHVGGSLIITGESGAGKSHMLLRIAHTAAEEAGLRPLADPDLRLPIYARFRDWTDELSLEAWLARAVSSRVRAEHQVVLDLIRARRVVLLLDGLDELESPQLRQSRLADIEQFQHRHGPLTVAVTCRSREYRQMQLGTDWRHAELAGLSADAVLAVLHRERLEALRARATTDPELSSILQNLFMLNAAAAVYRTAPVDAEAPVHGWRDRILERYVDLLPDLIGSSGRHRSARPPVCPVGRSRRSTRSTRC